MRAGLAAVLGYCGAPIEVWLGGRWQPRRGWARPQLERFVRLRPRLGALCDIPDLELFPPRYRVTQQVTFRAALEVALAQRAFASLAALRVARILRRPDRWAGMLHRLAPLLDRFGSACGGMAVRVQGRNAADTAVRREWHLTVDHGHGPEVPCLAAILLARRLARGQAMPVGAMPCIGLLALDDFAPEFARWGMLTEVVDLPPDPAAP